MRVQKLENMPKDFIEFVKEIRNNVYLTQHQKMHAKEQSLPSLDDYSQTCEKCNHKATNHGNMERHKKTCKKTMPKYVVTDDQVKCEYVYEEDKLCYKEFSTNNALKRHVREVHNKQPLNCDRCKFSSNRLENLKKHAKNKHGYDQT